MLDENDIAIGSKLSSLNRVTVSEEIKIDRIVICRNCEKFNSLKFCTDCNCYIPLKTWLKNSKCPLSKW
jgi:hypothetical protein